MSIVTFAETKPINKTDLYWLSRLVHAEAEGESIEGKMAVANIVMNRARIDNKTIKEVIFSGAFKQNIRNKRIYRTPSKDAIDCAIKALSGVSVLPNEAYYFYNPRHVSRGAWIRTRKKVKVIDNHVFCK